jgi:hypothetical protein
MSSAPDCGSSGWGARLFGFRALGKFKMDKKFKLIKDMNERKQAMLDELSIVHEVLSHAVSTHETELWLNKLEKWHQELHRLIEDMPKID